MRDSGSKADRRNLGGHLVSRWRSSGRIDALERSRLSAMTMDMRGRGDILWRGGAAVVASESGVVREPLAG